MFWWAGWWPSTARSRRPSRSSSTFTWRVSDLAQRQGGVIRIVGTLNLGIPAGDFDNTATITSTQVITYQFDNANRLYQFPMGIFGISLATAVFPLFSHYAAIGDLTGLRRTPSRLPWP